MPKDSKIAAGERRSWLNFSEGGKPIPEISKEAGRDVRTIREHIERARLERDFEAAQREQLREALRDHQRDMLTVLQNIRDSTYVPDLANNDSIGVDYGLEDLWGPSELMRNRENVIQPRKSADQFGHYGSAAVVTVFRDANGPQDIELSFETSRLGRALKEHIRKDPLWRHVASWRNALLEEFQRRAKLNRVVRVKTEQEFGVTVGWNRGSQQPWLGPGIITWTRARLTNVALGNYVPPVDEEVKERAPGSLETIHSHSLTQNIDEPEARLLGTIAALADCEELIAAARSFRNLQAITQNLNNAVDEYLLIHHIPGRCGLCKKLGGQ